MTLALPPGQVPRRWQLEAVDAARRGLQLYKGGCLVSAATGTGKGSVIAGIGISAVERRRRVWMLAHREELVAELPMRIRQARGPLAKVGLVMGNETHGLGLPIISAMVQSLSKRRLAEMLRFGPPDLVMTDEAHHAKAPMYQRVYDAVDAANPAWRHLGWTATPFRSAGNGGTAGIGDVFEALVYEYGIADAIAYGDLVPIQAFKAETQLSLEGVKVGKGGDFVEEDLAAIIDCESRNKVVVDKYFEHGAGQPGLVFAGSIAHAQHIAEMFRARGVNAAAVWGEMGDARRDLVARFKHRPDELPVLVSKDLLFEGFDAPRTAIILKARPTKSRIVFQQLIGRGLRTFGIDQTIADPEQRKAAIAGSAKPWLTFIDLVDNGCELDLATVADLSTTRDRIAERRALTEGTRVQRRHHEEWGVGTVLDGHDEEAVRVLWPVSKSHPETHRGTHPALELMRVVESGPITEGLSINPQVDGVQTYEVLLLKPEAGTRASKVGWYGYQKAHVVGGRMPDDTDFSYYVAGAGESWAVWTIHAQRLPATEQGSGASSRWHNQVERAHTTTSRELAMTWAEKDARERGVRISNLSAKWKGEQATDQQIGMLRKWRITRDLSAMSRGEASALIDAVMASAKVHDAMKRIRRTAA